MPKNPTIYVRTQGELTAAVVEQPPPASIVIRGAAQGTEFTIGRDIRATLVVYGVVKVSCRSVRGLLLYDKAEADVDGAVNIMANELTKVRARGKAAIAAYGDAQVTTMHELSHTVLYDRATHEGPGTVIDFRDAQ